MLVLVLLWVSLSELLSVWLLVAHLIKETRKQRV